MRLHGIHTVLALGLLAACSAADGTERGAAAEGPIVIGAPWPWKAQSGIRYGDGMQMAVDEINAAGGVGGRPLKLLRLDDNEDVDRGRLVARDLTRQAGVVAVIGHLQSYVTVPAAAIYDFGGVVHLAPTATSTELTRRGYRRLCRTTFSDAAMGREMAEYALRRGYRRVLVFYSRDEYGRGLANAFEERLAAGRGQVADRRSYDPGSGASAAAEAAAAWGDAGPDAVFVAGDGEAAARLAVQLRRAGIRAPLLGGDALAIPALLEVGGAAVEGTVIPSRFSPEIPNPRVKRFTADFRARFDATPDVGAALGYDAVRVLADAIRQAGTPTPDRVAAALRATRGWEGVTGTLAFDSAGDLVPTPIRKLVVRGGAFHYLDEGAETP